jgi:predicted dehydrogenase
VDPAIAGGGLFHDLAPHQLDLMYYFFGDFGNANGIAANQSLAYNAHDIVTGNILFQNGIIFSGTWCFNVNEQDEKDSCDIFGADGKISFNVFGEQKIAITKNGKMEMISFEPIQHVQQPMIEAVVNYFLDKAPNPCSASDGAKVMQLLDAFTL